MAQTTQQDISTTVTVGTAAATLATIVLNGLGRTVDVTFNNTGGTATTNMTVYRQFSAGGAWIPWFGGSDFSTPTTQYNASLTNTSVSPNVNSPNTISAAAVASLDCTPGAVVALQLTATVAAGTTTIVTTGAASLWDK